MSVEERRRSYQYNHILIDSDRILAPQFSDAVVFLSGAQIELLRNVSGYLNRRDTYVKENEPGYYMMPSDEDFDDILEIVADLEETLMGNPNTIWGYWARYSETLFLQSVGAQYTHLVGDTVPEGEVWTVEAASLTQLDATPREAGISVRSASTVLTLAWDAALATSIPLYWSGKLTLMEDDWINGTITDLPTDEWCMLNIWGYKMKIAT